MTTPEPLSAEEARAAIEAADQFRKLIVSDTPSPGAYYDSSLLPAAKKLIHFGICGRISLADRMGKKGEVVFWSLVALEMLTQYQDGVGPDPIDPLLGSQESDDSPYEDLSEEEQQKKIMDGDPRMVEHVQRSAKRFLELNARSLAFSSQADEERLANRKFILRYLDEEELERAQARGQVKAEKFVKGMVEQIDSHLGEVASDPSGADMPRRFTAVSSSQIAGLAHDETTSVLSVKFVRGAIYEYADVDRSVFESFLAAPSAGRFLSENIKGVYSFQQTADPQPKQPAAAVPKTGAPPASSGCLVLLIAPLLGIGFALTKILEQALL